MSELVEPGAGLLFMKVGVHAQETLEDIVARKMGEIDKAGYGLWGYGGNTCHPGTMVQPFAEKFAERRQAHSPGDGRNELEPFRGAAGCCGIFC